MSRLWLMSHREGGEIQSSWRGMSHDSVHSARAREVSLVCHQDLVWSCMHIVAGPGQNRHSLSPDLHQTPHLQVSTLHARNAYISAHI